MLRRKLVRRRSLYGVSVACMMQIIRNGGLGNGGTNFDAKTRRNSTDLEDIFIDRKSVV